MADAHNVDLPGAPTPQPWQQSVEEARAQARLRFKERLDRGEKVGGCSCGDDEPVSGDGDAADVVGVRFRDSGRVYFFQVQDLFIEVGTWVVVPTSRGTEAARVVIAPRQMLLSQLEGDLKPVDRLMDAADVERMDHFKRQASRAIRRAGEIARAHGFPIKPIAAEYSFDGAYLRISYSAADHVNVQTLRRTLQDAFESEVLLQQVGPRDEARLLGGLGRCGRTLCCSSWLPMYPDVSMNLVKNQELSLNPSKVSGVCGRLLCCLSYENEQYKKAKAILPRLGQQVMTSAGEGMVVSLQILRELVTVRLTHEGRDEVFPASEILAGGQRRPPAPAPTEAMALADQQPVDDDAEPSDESRRRRRRRRGRRSRSSDMTNQLPTES
jgi:cell fate regulator YaaT (PSP1 superfamily)